MKIFCNKMIYLGCVKKFIKKMARKKAKNYLNRHNNKLTDIISFYNILSKNWRLQWEFYKVKKHL